MGCAPSQLNSQTERSNGYHGKTKLESTEFIKDEKNGKNIYEQNGINKAVKSPKKQPLISKVHSLSIEDQSKEHARTGEEPAHPLPEADYGDMQLGITVS